MFDKLRDNWRKSREMKARKKAMFEAIKSESAETVKSALDAVRTDPLDDSDRGWIMKLAIERQDLKVFREALLFVDDPNTTISYEVRDGNYSKTYTYSPLSYALSGVRTHDISLALANNPRTNINGSMLDAARNGGMQDVAAVLAKRIADLRRQEAAVLDQEPSDTGLTIAPAAPAIETEGAPALAPGEAWALMSKTSVAHVTTSEAIGRKLTEIFNFESRERVIITENLKTGVETIGAPEKFEKLAPETVQRAEQELRQLAEPKKSFNL